MIEKWELVPLRVVCSIDKRQGMHTNLPYVGLEHIESGTNRFVGSLNAFSVKSTTFRFSNAHVLYGRLRPYLNKVLLPDFDGHCSTEIFPLLPSARLDRNFLCYWLSSSSIVTAIDATCTGARMPRANMDKVLDFALPLPPLSEQRRLVALLDEAFEAIATAKANTEKNLLNTRELFESRLANVFSSVGDDWKEQTLGSICAIARGGSPRPIQAFLTTDVDGINWIKISDATASGKYIFSTAEKIKPTGVSRSRLVRDGDFLLSNSMSFGRPYIMRTTGCIHDGWLVLSEYQDSFDQDFLYLLLGSQFVYRQFDRLAAGSTVRNLNIDLASSVRVPVPPLQEQVQMAGELGELSEGVEQVAAVCKRKLTALDELKKSLLHQAFTGRLTAKKTEQQLEAVP